MGLPSSGIYYDKTFVMDDGGTWKDPAYRTLVFDEPPTGELLEWLQANATPQ